MRVLTALLIALLAAPAFGVEPATAPSADDGVAPAAMAPAYIAIGKELRLRVALIRRTLDDLSLDASVRAQAIEIIDAADLELRTLLHDVESGRMPAYRTIMEIPQKMRAAHENLLNVIGADKAQLLDEKLRSLRGEARARLAKLRQEIDDLQLSDRLHRICRGVLGDADAAVEKLPDADVDGDAYAADRQAMERLFDTARDALAKVLSPIEESRLYPTTQPSPQG